MDVEEWAWRLVGRLGRAEDDPLASVSEHRVFPGHPREARGSILR